MRAQSERNEMNESNGSSLDVDASRKARQTGAFGNKNSYSINAEEEIKTVKDRYGDWEEGNEETIGEHVEANDKES